MDKPTRPDLDVYSLVEPAPQRITNKVKQPQECRDDDPTNDSFKPHELSMPPGHGFDVFVKWLYGIAASLVTIGIVSIATTTVSTANKVDVLLDRPMPVPVQQYENDMRQLKEKMASTEARVDRIEQRQLDSIARHQ